MSKHITRKRAILGLATLAVVSPLSVMVGGSPAVAAASDTCDTSLMTVTVTDSVTGAPLEGARFSARGGAYNWLKAGNALSEEAAYKGAYVDSLPSFWTTPHGMLITNASQETLGTNNKPAYPADITGVTDPDAQQLALQEWQADGDGRIAALRDDALRRKNAITQVMAFGPGIATWGQLDPEFRDHVQGQYDKLNALVGYIDAAKSASDWDTFVAAYEGLTDHANWSYGLSDSPDVEFQDKVVSSGNMYQFIAYYNGQAANAVGATAQLTPTTDANGEVQFTNFSVKQAWKDRGTRGDDTCSQLSAAVTLAKAPSGYKMDNATYTVASDDNGVGTLTIALDPEDTDTPDVPTRTNTGL